MIEKRKQGKAGKRMGISHEYHSTHGRRRRSKAGTGLRLAGVIAAILLLSLAITAILENGEKQSEAVQQSPAAGTAANILAPLPMQGSKNVNSCGFTRSSMCAIFPDFGNTKKSSFSARDSTYSSVSVVAMT